MVVSTIQQFLLRRGHQIVAILALLLLLQVAQLLRSTDIQGNVGIQNLETPWHALLTVQALAETNVRTHHYLPIVTLGGERNKGVPWGAANPDGRGHYFYTSATSPTFVLPHVWFSAFGLETTISSLASFNYALQVLSVLMLYAFLYSLLRALNVGTNVAAFSSVAASSISIFSREAFVAFGIVYWFHSIYQVLLIAALYFILRAVTKPAILRPWGLCFFFLICFLGAWVEWTGFAFNVGGAVILLVFRSSKEAVVAGAALVGSSLFSALLLAVQRSKVTMLAAAAIVGSSLMAGNLLALRSARERAYLAAVMLGATALAAIVIVAHYASLLDLSNLTWRMRARFEARSPLAHGGLLDNLLLLLQGYVLSFGLFLLVLLGGLFLVCRAEMDRNARKLLWLMLLLCAVPLAENIIVMENSAEFSYARLKFVVPAALVMAVALAFASARLRAAFAAMIVAASVFGFWSYKADLKYYAAWQAIDANNRAFRDKIMSEPDYDCSVLVTNVVTRGYATLLFHRMIFETWAFTGPSDQRGYLTQAMERTGACQGIFLEAVSPNTSPPLTNMPEYKNALFLDKKGDSRSIPAQTRDTASPPQSLFVRLFSHQGRDILKRW